jgi:integrase
VTKPDSTNDRTTRQRNKPVYVTDRYGIAVYAPTKHASDGGTFADCSTCGKPHDKPAGYPSYRITWYDHLTERTTEHRRTESVGTDMGRATRRANEIQNLITKYGSVAAAERATMTVAQLATEYLEPTSRSANVIWHSRTVENNERYARIHIVPALGKVKVKDLTHDHCKELLRALRRKGLAHGTIFNISCAFVGMVKLAAGRGYLLSADAVLLDHAGKSFVPSKSGVQVQGVEARQVQAKYVPELADLRMMRDELEERAGWQIGFFVEFLAHTGVRCGEGLALTIDDITFFAETDFEPARVEVLVQRQVGREPKPQHTQLPKRNKIRVTLYLGDMDELQIAINNAQHAYEHNKNPHRLLWWNESAEVEYDTYYTTHRLRHLWRECAERLGWEYETRPVLDDDGQQLLDRKGRPCVKRQLLWTLHGARHYFATWALRPTGDQDDSGLGLEPADVSALLGHSHVSITIRAYLDQRKGTMSRVAAAARRHRARPLLRSVA